MWLRSFSFGLGLGLALVATGCAVEEPTSTGAPEEDLGESTDAATVCAMDVVRGLDVSYYQGDIDWTAVAGAGYQFAITRVNHSTFMDPKFEENWAAIPAVGMIRGAYQYFEPGEDVAWQAQVMIDAVGQLGPGDLPAVIDVETDGGLPPAQVAQAVGEWLLLVEAATGKKPIIYTGKYFWQDNVASADYASYPLWHAQYPNACQPPSAPPPDCGCANIADQWADFLVWQYTSSGSVPGIAGNVDLNVFKGTYDDLVAFTSQGAYAAELVSVDVPATVLAGESFTARVTVENTGGSPLDGSTFLGTTEPRDRMSVFADATWTSPNRPAAVTGAVAPGEEHTFEFTMKAPTKTGSYTEHFGLVQEGVAWFADQGGPADTAIAVVVQVVDAPPGDTTGSGDAGGAGGAGGADGLDGDDTEDGCDCRAAGGAASDRRTHAPAFGFLLLSLVLCRALERRRSDA